MRCQMLTLTLAKDRRAGFDRDRASLRREAGGLPVIRLRTLIRTDWLEKTGYMRADGDQQIQKIQALAGG
jgi:hypothetical protein